MTEDPRPPLLKLCGLWENQGPQGLYFSGRLGHARILVFRNNYKQPGSKEPDWEVFLVKPSKEEALKKPPMKEAPTKEEMEMTTDELVTKILDAEAADHRSRKTGRIGLDRR